MQDTNDYGPEPFVADIEAITTENEFFRVAKWTGTNLQMTLMSIKPGQDVGLEVHPDNDQFLRIEAGSAKVMMGPTQDNLDQEWEAGADWAIFVPANTWHNIINTGDEPLKMYSIYAPSHHAHGTIHHDRAEADAAEAAEHDEA